MGKALLSSLQLEPFADLEKCAFISWFKEAGWEYCCRFVYVCFTLHIIQTSRTNFIFMIQKKITLTVKFFSSSNSTHFPFREKVGQLSQRKRVLCWSIYIIRLRGQASESTRESLWLKPWAWLPLLVRYKVWKTFWRWVLGYNAIIW